MYYKFSNASGAHGSVFTGRVLLPFFVLSCFLHFDFQKVVKRMRVCVHPRDAVTSNEPHKSRISDLEVGHHRPRSTASSRHHFQPSGFQFAGTEKVNLFLDSAA